MSTGVTFTAIAQEIVLMEPQLVRKMIIVGTGPAGGEGISSVHDQ